MASDSSDLSFKVLSLLSKERAVYGLRNGDYERYRRHCANKLHRLRQVSGLTCGKGKVFKKPPPLTASIIKDVKYLQLLLFSAERALAHSHSLKSLAKPDSPPDIKRDQISWLRRALKSSSSLYTISTSLSSRMNTQTLAEITIYHLSIRAELAFERSQWAEALTDLAARRRLLSTLADAARDSYDQALANEFMDEFDPLIRFCAYKLGRPEPHDIDGVVRDVDGEMMEEALPGVGKLVDGLRRDTGMDEIEAGRRNLEDVEFAGEKVEMRSAEIVGIMLKVQDALGRIRGKEEGTRGRGMKGWDRVLGGLGEAEGVARRLLEDHQASGSATSLRSTKTTESLSLAHQYIIYLLLSHRIRRDLLLVDTLTSSTTSLPAAATSFKVPGGRAKVEEAVKSLGGIIKLHDTVLQSMGQLRSLAVVEEKEGVRLAAEGAEAYYHATRCYHLARLHCIHPTPSFASAVQLLTRASLLSRQATTSLFESDTPLQEEIISLPVDKVNDLSTCIEALDLAAKRSLFAERVPKPVFFDTAFNYIDMPLDELLVLAGKKVAGAAPKVAEEMVGLVVPAVRSVVGKERTREARPALDDGGRAGGKGWLGGWFGRA